MSPPDVVIPVRPGERNEELRYALRSIDTCLPHGRVWIAGHVPSWISGEAGKLPRVQHSSKYRNSQGNLLTACQQSSPVAESIVLWNDDFFLLKGMALVPKMHRGPLELYVEKLRADGSKHYLRWNESSGEILAELRPDMTPVSYELHVPFPMTKTAVREAERLANRRPYQVRTLIGNLEGPTGVRLRDVKVGKIDSPWDKGNYFVSTNDVTFAKHEVGEYIRELYPNPCRYERG